MKRKKILINAYYAKNLGDDLFLKILFDRYSNVDWYLLGAQNIYKDIFKEYPNVFIHNNIYGRAYKLLKKIIFKKYDALLYIGGSIFMQTSYWKYRLEEREELLNIFKKMNKKVFILGANFGPYKCEEFLQTYNRLFKLYDDICFRDKYSYNLFKYLDNVRVAPDIIFQLKYEKVNIDKEVGFSIIDLSFREELRKYENEYKEKIKSLIQLYIDLGYSVNLFSFCNEEGDKKAIYKILENINDKYKKYIKVIDYDGDINKFINNFKSMDTIIGSRFHSIILALLFGQNVFPIIYSDKTYNVLRDLGLEGNCVYIKDIANIDFDKIIELSKKNKLKDRVIIEESEKHFLKLEEFIYE